MVRPQISAAIGVRHLGRFCVIPGSTRVQQAREDIDAALDLIRRRGREADPDVRGIGSETGSGGDEEAFLAAALQKRTEVAVLKCVADIQK